MLPISNQLITPPAAEPQPLTLIQCLHKPPHQWAQPLWHQIHQHAPLGQLKQATLQQQTILLVSDASISAWHTGTCAWVIWSTTQLWSSKGIVPSNAKDLYSGLAKAYGIYTVLQFFQNYISSFPIILPCLLSIKLYCNNQGVLDCLQQAPPPCTPMI